MDIKIEKIPHYKLAYFRHLGAYGENNIQTMEKIKNWAKSKKLFDEQAIIIAIAHDNPQITQPESCRYDACIVIKDDYKIDDNDNINQGEVFGGMYAVFKVKHTAEEVQKAWNGIFSELFNQNYKIDETRLVFERYIFAMLDNHYCEICIPIQK